MNTKVYELTIAKEPYLFFRVEHAMTVYTRINGSRAPIVVSKGNYLVIDRWFNLGVANEAEISQLIRHDYQNRRIKK